MSVDLDEPVDRAIVQVLLCSALCFAAVVTVVAACQARVVVAVVAAITTIGAAVLVRWVAGRKPPDAC